MSLRRALAPLLCAVACATGEPSEQGPGSSATVPTAPVETTATTHAESTSDAITTTTPETPTTSGLSGASQPPDPSTTTTSGDLSATASTTGDDTTTAPPATTADPPPDCDSACDEPPGPCYTSPGTCLDGACDYAPTADGSACDDGDACTDNDACNGAGSCTGTAKVCAPPEHASGGACEDGSCTGFTCTAPYDNCDGDWTNGCEVPVGVANQCSIDGLTTSGCWTAYCGDNPNADANFGSYHCTDCNNCHKPTPTTWQWCNHSNGIWYDPADGGSCGVSLDAVCAP